MSHQGKELAGIACLVVSAVHVIVDILKVFLPECPALELLHVIEPAMLSIATSALAFHLALERALFDRIAAIAHGSNLTFGWLSAAIEWLDSDVLHQLAWLPLVAGLALAVAAAITFVEVFGLRHRRRRLVFTTLAVCGALCCTIVRDGAISVMPPREHTGRAQLRLDVA